MLALLPALLGFALLKALVVPDPYVAAVMARVAGTFFDPRPLAGALAATLVAALAAWALLSRITRLAVPLVAAALLAWWLLADAPLHAEARYAMRTPLFLGTALLAFLAVLHARGFLPAWRVPLGAVAVVTLVHVGELARFTLGWTAHLAAVRALATSPGEGFAAVADLPPGSAPFAWHSTVPFLSAMATPGLAPARLVVDPASNYFWFGCAQARRNEAAARGVPAATRAQVTAYACAGRP